MTPTLPVFVYGTLRPGGWNHDRWLAPWLALPCRAAVLDGHELHHLDGLPYVVPGPRGAVVGDVAVLDGVRYDDALAELDRLEGVDCGHYRRVAVDLDGGERAWVWLAGAAVAARLGEPTLVVGGDWLARSA